MIQPEFNIKGATRIEATDATGNLFEVNHSGTPLFSQDADGNVNITTNTDPLTLTLAVKHTIGGAGNQAGAIEVWGENTAKFYGKTAGGSTTFNFGYDSNAGSVATIGYGNGAAMRMNSSHQSCMGKNEHEFLAQTTIKCPNTNIVGLVIKGDETQTNNLQQWQNSSNAVMAYLDFAGNISTTGNITSFGDIIVESGHLMSTNNSLGYNTGAGGTANQTTSKTFSVTLNKVAGTINSSNAALAGNTAVSFTVNCDKVRSEDIIMTNHTAGGSLGAYALNPNTVTNGSFDITITNLTTGSLLESIDIRYAVIKSVNS